MFLKSILSVSGWVENLVFIFFRFQNSKTFIPVDPNDASHSSHTNYLWHIQCQLTYLFMIKKKKSMHPLSANQELSPYFCGKIGLRLGKLHLYNARRTMSTILELLLRADLTTEHCEQALPDLACDFQRK